MGKKKQPEITEAFRLLHNVVEIAFSYKRDASYMPTSPMLESLKQLERQLHTACYAVDYIHSSLAMRKEARSNQG